MRIISNFKDFYDNLSYIGDFDTSTQYVRKTTIIEQQKAITPFSISGERHFVIRVLIGDIKYQFACLANFHGYGNVLFDFITKWSTDITDRTRLHSFYGINVEQHSTNIFNKAQQYQLQYKAPVIMHCNYYHEHTNCFIINPRLQEFKLETVLDFNETFQNIERFITNNLVSDNMPSLPHDDIVMRDSKGFDNMSFKKSPTKRR